jgi:hypothetical protein
MLFYMICRKWKQKISDFLLPLPTNHVKKHLSFSMKSLG